MDFTNFRIPSTYSETLPAVDILAVAAHPDDVEQTCGGTLLKMAAKGYRAAVLDLTAGEMGTRGTPEQRLEEAQASARILKLAWRGNLCLADARLENSLPARLTLAGEIRRLRPRTIVIPYWEGRHPDHYNASRLCYEACFAAGLAKLDDTLAPHRPHKIVYASQYANVPPTFVVDISAEFDQRMESLLAYQSQYGEQVEGSGLFPRQAEMRDRLGAVARFYGSLIGVRYGEPFVMKETMAVEDLCALGVRSI
jgi:bacillithiol biosynthesis deacetylase BshB1